MARIVINIPVLDDVRRRLESLPGAEIVITGPGADVPEELPESLLAEAEVLVCKLPPTNHAVMKSLKLVQLASVGFTQLLPLRLPERGVKACNARGVYDTAIAEWSVAMMVNLARNLRGMIRNQDRGIWDRDQVFCTEIRGRTLGIWGYGGIGRETARLAKLMGLDVHVLARRGVRPRGQAFAVAGTGDPEGTLPDRVFTAGEETEFLGGLDFLLMALPLSPATTGLLGERELRALKPGAFLLNPARGPLIQEKALLQALDQRWIAGAALDTHYHYPMPPEHPLWHLPQVIMTPHISGTDKSTHFLSRMGSILEHNLGAHLQGGPLWNEISPGELY